MQPNRAACARRRTHHTPRVVRLPVPLTVYAPGLATVEEANAYQSGIEMTRWLKQYFPEYYQAHVAQRAVSLPVLYGATCAFFRLVDTRLVSIEENEFFSIFEPEDQIVDWAFTQSTADIISAFQQGDYYLEGPRPWLCGIGLNDLIDNGELEHTSLCTRALWWIARDTAWGLGIDFSNESLNVSPGDHRFFAALPRLPAQTNMEQFVQALNKDNEPGEIGLGTRFAYAFSQTGQMYADTSNYDIEVNYGGEFGFDWADLEDVVTGIGEAQVIATAYINWSGDQTKAAIEDLAERLVHIAYTQIRTERRKNRKPKTLVQIISAQEFIQGRTHEDQPA